MAWSDAARAAALAARQARAVGRRKGGKSTALSFARNTIVAHRHAAAKVRGSGIKQMSARWYNLMRKH